MQGRPRAQLVLRSSPMARTRVWAKESSIGGEFIGPASSVDMGTGLPSSLTSYCRGEKNHPKQTLLDEEFRAAFSGGFPASLPRAYPRLTGSLGQSPLPQQAKLNQGQCFRSDPILPAPTSILFAGPLSLRWGPG